MTETWLSSIHGSNYPDDLLVDNHSNDYTIITYLFQLYSVETSQADIIENSETGEEYVNKAYRTNSLTSETAETRMSCNQPTVNSDVLQNGELHM